MFKLITAISAIDITNLVFLEMLSLYGNASSHKCSESGKCFPSILWYEKPELYQRQIYDNSPEAEVQL